MLDIVRVALATETSSYLDLIYQKVRQMRWVG